MPLFALELTTVILFFSASLKPTHLPSSLFSMLLSDLLLAFLTSLTSPTSCRPNQLHWLPLSARIEFKLVVLVLKSKLGVAPKYLRDQIRFPLSANSHRPLRSLDW